MRTGAGRRWAAVTAIAGTVFIAAGAFWLSFTALADLAARSGVGRGQAWAWPLILDGIIIVSTVAVVALAGQRSAWYPWTLLAAGAVVSVTANAIHAVVAADADVPGVLAASVAAVPPLVLLAITHLTVILTRPAPGPGPVIPPERSPESDQETAGTVVPPSPVGREAAVLLREEQGWSNKQIARYLGVHPSTVGRWFARPALTGAALTGAALTGPDREETP